MRKIKHTNQFKRDYKRELKSGHKHSILNKNLKIVIEWLVLDEPLPHRYYDHPLSGNWNDHRDCHIRPDLILIYRKPDNRTLELVRLGSQSEPGL
jgi:mRNA interferase YafQ